MEAATRQGAGSASLTADLQPGRNLQGRLLLKMTND